jgi:hypothetical protein
VGQDAPVDPTHHSSLITHHSTIWPFVCGAGVALLAFGMLTSLAFSLVGLLLIVRSLAGWIGELRHE